MKGFALSYVTATFRDPVDLKTRLLLFHFIYTFTDKKYLHVNPNPINTQSALCNRRYYDCDTNVERSAIFLN
jgi:hypothetical protein